MPYDPIPTIREPELVSDLRRARALIDRPDKWLKREARSLDGTRMCLVQAINDVTQMHGQDITHSSFTRCNAVIAAMMAAIHPSKRTLIDWNDDDRRRHRDVMAAFDKAISRALSEQALVEQGRYL